ncbi:MAG: hypothetical protein A2Z18_11120 [Armatimonadetes bacterium RBG_16_58_9]|nr:MAG: hypothetical protein A2Z18_11120 [Armatimonadetes bacterium RBG_16_58_9]
MRRDLVVGRPRIPTAIKLVRGNPGKRPLNQREPQPQPGPPPMPEKLASNELAAQEWHRLCPMLERMRVLTEADGIALANLCFDVALLDDCQKKLSETGLLVRNKATGLIHRNPLVDMLGQTTDRVTKALREFGMTPASRSNIQVAPETAADNPWEKLKRQTSG